MRVLDDAGRLVRTIDPIVLTPLSQIEGVLPVAGGTRIVTTPDGTDPMLLMKVAWTARESTWRDIQFVTPFSLAWIGAACGALVLAAVLCLARDVWRGPVAARHIALLAALFLIVVWGKLLLFEHYPMPVPYWDQWDGEAAGLYIPFANGALTWQQMFTLHNEHRIFFTRVLALVLVAINGQWDPMLQIVVNAYFHALAAVVFATSFWLAAGRRWLPLIALTVGLVIAAPFGLENSFVGLQSGFYFMILFSALATWLVGMHRPGTFPWYCGWLCAFAALVCLGSGVLTAAPIGAVIVLRLFNDPRTWRAAAVNIVILATTAAVGYAILSPPLPYHDFLKAGTWLAFKVSLARNLAFPWITSPRLSVLLWIPLFALSIAVLRRRMKTTALEMNTIALGAWVALQAIALAYSRGVNGATPASRYLDMLSLGFVANTMALIALWEGFAASRARRLVSAGLVVWVTAGMAGIYLVSAATLAKDGNERRQAMELYVKNVRAYVTTGDLAPLLQKHGPAEIPYFSPMMLAGWLQHPYVRRILPATLRQPIELGNALSASATGAGGTPEDRMEAWDSYRGGRAKAQGRFESQPIECREVPRPAVRGEQGPA